ncbi:hypothetical protein BDD12DRAFT_199079 [Trichophaea hybrida]|nr:hypothetical protein BDD12DRAFT_199079 [Trichophaea hybrida]
MLTGIEIANLTLSIFPLVLKGLDFYLQLAPKMKEIKDYQEVLVCVVRELKLKKARFENTCEFLLEGVLWPEQLAKLLDGNGWSDLQFQEVLEMCLRPNAAQAFTDAVTDLRKPLNDLAIGL